MSTETIAKIKNEIDKHRLVKGLASMRKHELIDIKSKIEKYVQNKTMDDYYHYQLGDHRIKINEEQYKVVTEDISKNIRIIACAGSGKTLTVCCRIKYLIDHGQLPERIMLTTFNVDAAESMKSRIKLLFGFLPNITIGTIDSIACRLWNRYFRTNKFIGISEFASELLNFLQTSANKEKILGAYDYVFFDEFQDCNAIQFQIVKEFASYGSKVTVVGDDAQNIYQWRGSQIEFILNLDKYIPNLITHKLVNNYRSTPEIIKFANMSISYNSDQIPKQMISNKESINFSPTIIQFNSDEDQCFEIIKMILKFVSNGIKYDQIAILSRNNYCLKLLEEHIVKLNSSKKKPESNNKIKQKLENSLDEFYEEITSTDDNDFMPYIALITEDNSATKPKVTEGHLTLTTIHKSKGLEWDVVFLIGSNDKVFPSEIDDISIQEERRLFYVAITRPKKYLYITFTKKSVSRFVAEVPMEFYNFVNFKEEYFTYDNLRGLKFDTGVTKLIQMLNETDYQELRNNGILPDIQPTIKKIHGEHHFGKYTDRYYLHPDFGEFIDRYISRNIGKINNNSNGLLDRSAEIVISSCPIQRPHYDIYKKYEINFKLNINKIKNDTPKNQYIKLFSIKNKKFDKITRGIDYTDIHILTDIIGAIVKTAKENNKEPKDILVVPTNYLPAEIKSLMALYYNSYKNKGNKTLDVLKDVYSISLCGNILADRRRLLYKDVFSKFTEDPKLFTDIKKYTTMIKNDNLLCKKYICDETRSIEGEIDLLNFTTGEIIDFKCSKDTNCKIEWLLQLLTYCALIKVNKNELMKEHGLDIDNDNLDIKMLTIYNPLQGNLYQFDVGEWDYHEDLLEYLDFVRLRQLSKVKVNYNNFEYGSQTKWDPDLLGPCHVFQDDQVNLKDNLDEEIKLEDNLDEKIKLENEPKNNLINDKPFNKSTSYKYMVLDTETTGLPKMKKAGYSPYTELDKYDSARVVQISWLVMDAEGKIEDISDHVIKINNLENTYGTSMHGISDVISEAIGIEFDMVCDKFMNDLDRIDCIVGHNIDFDIHVLKSELFRSYKENIIKKMDSKDILCTMKQMGEKLNKSRPSLAESYFQLFNKLMIGAHNSKYDIIYTSKVLCKILEIK